MYFYKVVNEIRSAGRIISCVKNKGYLEGQKQANTKIDTKSKDNIVDWDYQIHILVQLYDNKGSN